MEAASNKGKNYHVTGVADVAGERKEVEVVREVAGVLMGNPEGQNPECIVGTAGLTELRNARGIEPKDATLSPLLRGSELHTSLSRTRRSLVPSGAP